MAKNIVLIGIRGSGKSTIGKLLAEKIGIDFVDLDQELMKAAGVKKMIEMIKNRGNQWIVETEHKLLNELLGSKNRLVIGTGGRIFSHELPEIKVKNIAIVKKQAIAVLPLASEAEMWRRIVNDQHKEHAHLSTEKLRQNFIDSLEFIDKYKKAADIIIKTDNKTPEQTVNEIIKLI